LQLANQVTFIVQKIYGLRKFNNMFDEPFFKKFFKGDYALWVIILFLCLVSVLVVYSSTVALAQKQAQDNSHFLFSQSAILLGGVLIMWGISSFLNPTWIVKHARVILYFAIILSAMVYITGIGVEKNDAKRWITLPFLGVPINPFDFLRIAVILDLACQLTKKRDIIYKIRIIPNFLKLDDESRKKNWMILKNTTSGMLLPSFLAIILVFKENLSTAIVISIMILTMLALGNVRKQELRNVAITGIVVVVLMVSVFIVFGLGRGEAWKNRIIGLFVAPVVENVSSKEISDDTKAEYYEILRSNDKKNSNYQRTYAKIAMASGGLIGKGPGNSTLRSKLPNSYDDFAYAIVVEEYGFMGGMVVLILYIALLFRGITIAMRSKYYSLRLAALGLVIHMVFTAFIHMSVATGNMFTTGQTLPLISRGGSSILANSIALGIILCISAHKVKKENTENVGDSAESDMVLDENEATLSEHTPVQTEQVNVEIEDYHENNN